MANKRRSGSYLPAATIVAALRLSVAPQAVRADFTVCASNQLSWYTNMVGETPCMTYQRLRQICNKDYRVHLFASTVPGDRCDDKVSTLCCCNMVAFQLSMLCMVCQQDTQNAGAGIDAGEGAFATYQDGCTSSPAENHTLPDNIQSLVCKQDIRLENFLYGGWEDGAWFYLYTKVSAERNQAIKTNTTSSPRCQNAVGLSSTPLITGGRTSGVSSGPTTGASGSSNSNTPGSKSQSNLALIVGIVGSFLSLAIVVLAVVIWRRRATKTQGLEGASDPYEYSTVAPASIATGSPPDALFRPNRLVTEGGDATRVSYGRGPPFMPGTTWSDSGSLPPPYDQPPAPGVPPAYDNSWDNGRDGRTRPSAGSAPIPSSGFASFKKLRGGRR